MLKSLAIVVLVASILPIYGQQKSSQTGSDQTNRESAQNPAAIPSRVITCVVKQEGTTIECNWTQSKPEGYFKRLSAPENAPNITLVFVGILGVIAAVGTLVKIERQTKATEDAAVATQNSATAMFKSVELQEIQFRQWVEIGDWENMTHYIQPTSDKATIIIRFKVGNTTKFPLTLKVVTTKRLGQSDTFAPNTLVPPEEGYPADFSVAVEGRDLALYRENNYVFGLAIEVTYEDVLRKDWPQHFLHVVHCGPTRCDVTELRNRHEAEY